MRGAPRKQPNLGNVSWFQGENGWRVPVEWDRTESMFCHACRVSGNLSVAFVLRSRLIVFVTRSFRSHYELP